MPASVITAIAVRLTLSAVHCCAALISGHRAPVQASHRRKGASWTKRNGSSSCQRALQL